MPANQTVASVTPSFHDKLYADRDEHSPGRELVNEAILIELSWLRDTVLQRIDELREDRAEKALPPPPILPDGHYQSLIEENQLLAEDRLLLILALAPSVQPLLLNRLLIDDNRKYLPLYTAFGGLIDKLYLNFLPTVRTAAYLLAGENESLQLQVLQDLHRGTALQRKSLLTLKPGLHGSDPEEFSNFALSATKECLHYCLHGKKLLPQFGAQFPARRIETSADWEDLILPEATHKKVQTVVRWCDMREEMEEVMGPMYTPGYTCLFYGPPGTGKTLAVKLLGKHLSWPVYRVDLSALVSKYIGETEKSLARLFDEAENRNWILFFDEADAIFGKRTEVKESNDRYANLQISYLLQRIEDYRGLVILASNLKDNIDKALLRRFQHLIEFELPGRHEQLMLWRTLVPKAFSYGAGIDLEDFTRHSFSGANIASILKAACLECMADGKTEISERLLRRLVRVELAKYNRSL